MTAVEKVRQEGIEKGIGLGIEKGRVETREDFVKKLLAKGTMSPEEISRTFDLDLMWVKELADSLRKT